MNNNIFRCRVCGRFAISEELDSHECRSLKDYIDEGDIIAVFDGYSWYPLNVRSIRTRRFLTQRKSDVDLTEPFGDILNCY